MKRSLPSSLPSSHYYIGPDQAQALAGCQCQECQAMLEEPPAKKQKIDIKLPAWFMKNGYEIRFGKVVRKAALNILFFNAPGVTEVEDIHPLRDIWSNILVKVQSLNFVDQWLDGRIQYFQAVQLEDDPDKPNKKIEGDLILDKFIYSPNGNVNFIFGRWYTFLKQIQELELVCPVKMVCTYFNKQQGTVAHWYYYDMS